MIDEMYNYRQGEIHSAEFNKLCIPFEESLSEKQIDVFHKAPRLRERDCRCRDENCLQCRLQGRCDFDERDLEKILLK